jgi:hypothetical protein
MGSLQIPQKIPYRARFLTEKAGRPDQELKIGQGGAAQLFMVEHPGLPKSPYGQSGVFPGRVLCKYSA